MWKFESARLNRFEIRENMFESDKLRIAELSKRKKIAEIKTVKIEDFPFSLKNCPTIRDREDLIIALWLWEECLKGDKDACRILKEGCKWENTGENWLIDIGD